MQIASTGYSLEKVAHGGNTIAFFPLYPILARIVGEPFGTPFIGGLIFSNLCLISAACFLYKIIERETDHETGMRAVLFMFVFPTSFFFSAMYAESLLLLCILASFYFGLGKRWALAGMFGGLAALTKLVGVLLIIPLFWEYMAARSFSLRRIQTDVIFLALVPVGLGFFMVFNYTFAGDFFAFVKIQSAWGTELSNPLFNLHRLLTGSANLFVNGLVGLAALILAGSCIRKIRVSFTIWNAVILTVPIMSVVQPSLARYTLMAFPIFFILARFPRDKTWNLGTAMGLAMLQALFMIFWTNSFYIIL